jgi:hypothetical protein
MSNNTKARSQQLNTLAAEIAARENVDPANPPADNRAYITKIMTRGECHRETARAVWARYLRRARHPLNSWGGAGRGQGRKPTLREPDESHSHPGAGGSE